MKDFQSNESRETQQQRGHQHSNLAQEHKTNLASFEMLRLLLLFIYLFAAYL